MKEEEIIEKNLDLHMEMEVVRKMKNATIIPVVVLYLLLSHQRGVLQHLKVTKNEMKATTTVYLHFT